MVCLNNPGGPEGDTVTVAEKLLNTVSPGFIRLSVQAGRQLLRQVVALCCKVGGMKDEVLHRKAGDVVYVMCI